MGNNWVIDSRKRVCTFTPKAEKEEVEVEEEEEGGGGSYILVVCDSWIRYDPNRHRHHHYHYYYCYSYRMMSSLMVREYPEEH